MTIINEKLKELIATILLGSSLALLVAMHLSDDFRTYITSAILNMIRNSFYAVLNFIGACIKTFIDEYQRVRIKRILQMTDLEFAEHQEFLIAPNEYL